MRDAEVGDFYQTIFHYHHIGRLDVAMDDAMFVRKAQTIGDLRGDMGYFFDRQHDAGIENFTQFLAFQELHRHIGHAFRAADVVDGDDIRMIEFAGRLHFALEALLEIDQFLFGEVEVDGFDRDRAVDERIYGLIDDAHGALTDFLDDHVAAEFLDDHVI